MGAYRAEGFIKSVTRFCTVPKSLKLYEPGYFNSDSEPLLPMSYRKPKTGKHFKMFELTLSIAAIAASLILILKYALG